MSRRTRAQLPIVPQLLRPVVEPGTYQKLLANKERQVLAYNRSARDLEALRSGDTVRFTPPGKSTKEAVKAKVERCVGTRSYEVVTKDGARYRRNRCHLRKIKEPCEGPKPSSVAEGGAKQPSQQLMSFPGRGQTSNEPAAPCFQTDTPSSQADTTNEPVLPSGNAEPVALPVQGATTRSGGVVRRPGYLKDYV